MSEVRNALHDVIEQATSSEEMAAKVLKKLAGGYKYALQEYLDHVVGAYDMAEDDPDYAVELTESIGKCVDEVLNETVEKEILGAIPKT